MTQTEFELAASAPHRACTQLEVNGLQDDTVHRFILGLDEQPQPLSAAEVGELGDPFATRLMAAGIFPNTAGEVLQALERVDPGGVLANQSFFLVGEGSQLPAERQDVRRNMRFLVSCGAGAEGAEVVVSAFHPDEGMVELMAWDARTGGFNFYRTMPDSNAWMFAGNSRHALTAPTRGHGPFESHLNGNIVMKELKVPWVHWHSPFAQVPATSLKAQGLDQHPWVSRLDSAGAYVLEDAVVRPGITRWSNARAAAITTRDGGAQDPVSAGTPVAPGVSETPTRMLEQVTSTLTVNLVSSLTTFNSAIGGSSAQVDLPGTFFVDADLLSTVGLPGPQRFAVPSDVYVQTLNDLGVRLSDGGSFSEPGDTHFAFVVPERAFEDVATIRAAITAGLITPRLVACLVMVDFVNPIFSSLREALTAHIIATTWEGSGATFSAAVAEAINSSAQASVPGTGEAMFAANWAVGDDFVSAFTTQLQDYYAQVAARVTTADGFSDFWQLAESRRDRVRTMPISETELLFPSNGAPPAVRAMTPDARVIEVDA